jgi:hypothetical protein
VETHIKGENSMSDNPLVVVNNPVPQEIVVAKKMNALSRLFQLKPSILELVSKATRQEGATPGTFRVTSTNEAFKEMRVVMVMEPQEQREMYRKGEYTKDAKECFSLDNVSPHPRAKQPPALYCSTCPMGDVMWDGWRKAKDRGISGDQLTALLPRCKKFWHLFIVDRNTKVPYWMNIKGMSVKPFEAAMQNVARLFQMIIANIKAEIKAGKDVTMPNSIGEVIWKISFTMVPKLEAGTWQANFKDFKVMSPEDAAEFGQIYADIVSRKQEVQSQESAEQEAEATASVVEQPSASATAGPVSSTVAEANAKIVI